MNDTLWTLAADRLDKAIDEIIRLRKLNAELLAVLTQSMEALQVFGGEATADTVERARIAIDKIEKRDLPRTWQAGECKASLGDQE